VDGQELITRADLVWTQLFAPAFEPDRRRERIDRPPGQLAIGAVMAPVREDVCAR
jgi:hypothetical protein